MSSLDLARVQPRAKKVARYAGLDPPKPMPGPAKLDNLPREVRDKIYKLVLGNSFKPFGNSGNCRHGPCIGHVEPLRNHFALTCVSRQIRTETLDHIVQLSEIVFYHAADMYRLPLSPGPLAPGFARMGHVTLEMNVIVFKLLLGGKSAKHTCIRGSRKRRCECASVPRSVPNRALQGLVAAKLTQVRLVTPVYLDSTAGHGLDAVFSSLIKLIGATKTIVIGWEAEGGCAKDMMAKLKGYKGTIDFQERVIEML